MGGRTNVNYGTNGRNGPVGERGEDGRPGADASVLVAAGLGPHCSMYRDAQHFLEIMDKPNLNVRDIDSLFPNIYN